MLLYRAFVKRVFKILFTHKAGSLFMSLQFTPLLLFVYRFRNILDNDSWKLDVSTNEVTNAENIGKGMTPFSFLTSRWRRSSWRKRAPIPFNGPRDKRAMTIFTRLFPSLMCARTLEPIHYRPIHPRRSRDLIPATHLLDWGRTNFSISRQLRGYERVERQTQTTIPGDVQRNLFSNPASCCNSVVTVEKCSS